MHKTFRYRSLCGIATALLLASTAVAQSTDSKSSTPAAPTTAATKAKPAATARVDQYGHASGVQATDARSSAHASEKLDATVKADVPANAKSSETVEYKDPEDMTTRYRPGNNKTTRVPANGTSTIPPTAPTGQATADAEAKKHVANVKYGDRTLPASAGAAKDAAKAPASTLDAGSKDAAK